MKHIKILLLSLASSFAAFAADINVSCGQLEGLLADEDIKNESSLKLKGSIDARDLAALEKLSSKVTSLDLKDVKIEGVTLPNRKYFGRTLFSEGEIPAYTFFKSGVETLVLPATTTLICEGAFAGSAIQNIVIPEGVTSLGDYAFYGCDNLVSVSLPSTLKSIGKGAFGNCTELRTLNLSPTKITEIPQRAFAGSVNLESVILPASAVKVGRESFSHTKISRLNLSGVSEFEDYALSSMPFLTELSINPNAKIREGLLMDDTSLQSLTSVPSMVPDYFAANCSKLEAQEVIKDVAELGNYSFANTRSEVLVLPNTLTKVNRGALAGLINIAKIDVTALAGSVPEADQYSFEGLDQPKILLAVDKDYLDEWKNDPYWSLFDVKSSDETGMADMPAVASEEIKISCLGGKILITSSAIINDVRIYTTDGRMAYVASPSSDSVEIETASLPSGIVIVSASDIHGNAQTVSILL